MLWTMGTSLRKSRSALNTEFIQPNKDLRNKLKLAPREHPKITKSEWKEFVDRMFGIKFQVSYITVVINSFVTLTLLMEMINEFQMFSLRKKTKKGSNYVQRLNTIIA